MPFFRIEIRDGKRILLMDFSVFILNEISRADSMDKNRTSLDFRHRYNDFISIENSIRFYSNHF